MPKQQFDYVNLIYGICPKCPWSNDIAYLKAVRGSDYIKCKKCSFKIARDKYFSKVKPGSIGYFRIKADDLTEEEAMDNISMLM